MSPISIIAALDENGLIGRGNGLPWPRIKEDMKHFRRTTLGHAVLMGRKTFESIGGRPLPLRSNIILTRNLDFAHPDCEIIHEPNAVLAQARPEKIFVIGGATVYEQFLPHADELYLTQIGGRFSGDTYFPTIPWHEWLLREEKLVPADDENRWPLRFTHWERL